MRTRTAVIRAAAVLAGTVLLCAACGTDDNPSPPLPALPSDYHGVAITGTPGSPPLPPAPSPQFGPQIISSAASYTAQTMSNDLAWEIGEQVTVTPDCASQLANTSRSSTFVCDARWPGVGIGVPFQVAISVDSGSGSGSGYSVQVTQLKGLILAAEVRQAWLRRYIQDTYEGDGEVGTLSCDKSIPSAVLVPFGKPTPYRCAVAGEIYYAEVAPDPDETSSEYQTADQYQNQVVFTSTGPAR